MTNWRWIALGLVATIAVMYGMVYVDVVYRAKHSFDEGEKYWRWADHPEERAGYLDGKFAAEKSALDTQLAKGKLTKDDYDHSLELLRFDHEQALKESSIKYAYVWYQT